MSNIDKIRFLHIIGELYDKRLFEFKPQYEHEADYISNKRIFLTNPYNIPCSSENTHIIYRTGSSTIQDIADTILYCIENDNVDFVDGILQGMSKYFLEHDRRDDCDFCLNILDIGYELTNEGIEK